MLTSGAHVTHTHQHTAAVYACTVPELDASNPSYSMGSLGELQSLPLGEQLEAVVGSGYSCYVNSFRKVAPIKLEGALNI